jgi:hypothetical protein
VRSTYGPVSLAYEPELKVGFCADRPNSGCVRVPRRAAREADSSRKLADSAGRAEFLHPTGCAAKTCWFAQRQVPRMRTAFDNAVPSFTVVAAGTP